MPLADYQALVPRLVRDQSQQITPQDVDRAIAAAVRQYSGDRPRELVRDVTWSGGHFGTPPAEFTLDSKVLEAESPVGQVPPQRVTVVVALGVDDSIGLVSDATIAAGATVRLTFTAPHQVTSGATDVDTVPTAHREAVAMFAAAQLLRELATYYSGERESSIGADGSNTESRARNYAARARDCRAAYYAALRLVDPMATGKGSASSAGSAAAGQPASAVVSWPARTRGFRSNAQGL